jgi:hypothetical protein
LLLLTLPPCHRRIFGTVWRGIVDSSGNTQSISPLFKMMVPHPGQVVVLGPIFTPRKINDDELELEILLMPITKLLFVVEFSPPPTA